MNTNYNHDKVMPLPDSQESKKEQVAEMFNRISGKYDFLNHIFSLGIDKGWRKKAIRSLVVACPKRILDVATGTGDLAIAALKARPEQIVGIDISKGMLEIGKRKITENKLNNIITLESGDSENIHYDDNYFDAITCGYGVRNFEHLEKGLLEMNRVMRPGGRLAILEFSKPKAFPFKQIYNFYFRYTVPNIGKRVSKDATAYSYLPESVAAFPEGKSFLDILEKCKFTEVKASPLTFGITTLYTATKSK